MSKDRQFKDDLARKLQTCLREAGVAAELELSEHEALVHARVSIEAGYLKIIVHLTDREAKLNAAGGMVNKVAANHRLNIAVRPTLANQAAARGEEGVGFIGPGKSQE